MVRIVSGDLTSLRRARSARGGDPDTRARVSSRVLLVTRRPEVVSQVYGVLPSHGYPVAYASDLGQAIEAMLANFGHVQLVLTDVTLGASSGLELARRLRALDAELRIVYLSGPGDDVRVHGVVDPKSGFLCEPFRRREILASVRALLAGLPERGRQATSESISAGVPRTRTQRANQFDPQPAAGPKRAPGGKVK